MMTLVESGFVVIDAATKGFKDYRLRGYHITLLGQGLTCSPQLFKSPLPPTTSLQEALCPSCLHYRLPLHSKASIYLQTLRVQPNMPLTVQIPRFFCPAAKGIPPAKRQNRPNVCNTTGFCRKTRKMRSKRNFFHGSGIRAIGLRFLTPIPRSVSIHIDRGTHRASDCRPHTKCSGRRHLDAF